MKKIFISLAIIFSAACAKESKVADTWLSLDNYSIDINADSTTTEVRVPPSVRVTADDTLFKGTLKLTLRYPKADERADLGLISIFSQTETQVDLPKAKFDVSYLLLDTLIEDKGFDNPLIEKGAWAGGWLYTLNPGQEVKLKIEGAGRAKLVVVRTKILAEDGKTLLASYLHGFEIGE